jgi:putative heme-binding domain-containing protein
LDRFDAPEPHPALQGIEVRISLARCPPLACILYLILLETVDMTVPRLILALLLLPSVAIADESQVVALWPGGPPGHEGKPAKAEKIAGKAHHRLVSSIHQPSLTVFLPPREKANGAAVVICPGGGHRYLAIDHEGYDVARYLASQGVAGFVLKYRLANEDGSSYKVDIHALADARRAVRLVRAQSKEWGVDPARVGVMGFSAGGELAILAGTRFETGETHAVDPIDRKSSRPDFLMLIYPGLRGTVSGVTKETPPTFLAVADDDKRCAAVCVNYYQELKKAGVPGELHIYGRGGHGFGMNDRPMPVTSWTARMRDWLADSGYLEKAPPLKATSAKPIPKGYTPPAARIKAPKGFQVDLIYSVPKEKEGSWVNMTVDPKGRLIVSDQYGKLYRVSLPPVGDKNAEIGIEAIDVPIGEAQGLLWAFDSLYVVVNHGRHYESGLYRVLDTNHDDRLDKVEQLRKLDGGGEHGPHAVILAPDGKSLYVVAGNATNLTKVDGSLVPRIWGEDNLLPRMVDGSGFMADEKAPGGHICRVSPDGKHWELVAIGYRNSFDIAFNRAGELFTYDSDMEWDVNMPWYRPTRVLHVVSGGDYGYRNGSGKWPSYYIDSLPPVVNVGPGSPTGVTFGYGAKFPAKYQEALYLCDWSYGKLYALHLTPKGATYGGELEEFLAGTPLALTDVVVNPKDGAMYFAVGGRNTQSGLYRVTYTDPGAPTSVTRDDPSATDGLRALRHSLEAFHGHKDPGAIAAAWPHLGHPDRFVRWAARVAVEFQDPASWRDKALAEQSSPEATLNALLALAQVSAQDPAHRDQHSAPPDAALRDKILTALDRVAIDPLPVAGQLDLLRLYQVVLNRFGRPDRAIEQRLIARVDPYYPSRVRELNAELCNLLVYLRAPDAAAKTVGLLEKAPTQEEQMHYAQALRTLDTGWTPTLRRAYFSWIATSGKYRGGNSLRGFMANIKRDAVANLSDSDKVELKPLLDARPVTAGLAATLAERPIVKDWTVDELAPALETGLTHRDYDRGRTLFAAAKCFACHRCNDEGGGVGPDLTGVAGRFSSRDLLESIILPSKTISDQYESVTVATADGRVISGRIVNLNGDNLMINPDMLDPNNMVNVPRSQIEEIKRSSVSMMPVGLLNSLNKDEILDLAAYLLSRGDRQNPMFRRAGDTTGSAGTHGPKQAGFAGR